MKTNDKTNWYLYRQLARGVKYKRVCTQYRRDALVAVLNTAQRLTEER